MAAGGSHAADEGADADGAVDGTEVGGFADGMVEESGLGVPERWGAESPLVSAGTEVAAAEAAAASRRAALRVVTMAKMTSQRGGERNEGCASCHSIAHQVTA